ncbi:hypothetical protein QF037_004472 [Streptomyces canus]|uniref:PIN domain-containing protein n=1 Tax=Streptomyces canus TaxID=58343 RepID=UPI0027874DF6|nr:PIN domain-containing protein [Streptomyces canus]MDQ0600127.1 hypothetical protein [Streptomyces canus]
MIILDTNILWDVQPDSPIADLLRALRSTGVQQVSIPWLVLEELVGQEAIKYQEKHEKAAQSFEQLLRVTPWKVQNRVPRLDLDRVREFWRKEYRTIVDVIPSSENALREGAFREMNALAPCKKGKQGKTDFRDAVIWMSAVEYARDHRDETVFFVSNNTQEFGDGTDYRFPMNEDVKELGERFVHLTQRDELLKRFTKPAEVNEDQVTSALRAEEARDAVAREAASGLMRSVSPHLTSGFECRVLGRRLYGTARLSTVDAWLEPPAVTFDSVRDISAFSIGEHSWCTARARWLVAGLGVWLGVGWVGPVACSWETSVLLSPSNAEAGLTLLRGDAPLPATWDEVDRIPESGVLSASAGEIAEVRTTEAWRRLANLNRHNRNPDLSNVEATLARLANVLAESRRIAQSDGDD